MSGIPYGILPLPRTNNSPSLSIRRAITPPSAFHAFASPVCRGRRFIDIMHLPAVAVRSHFTTLTSLLFFSWVLSAWLGSRCVFRVSPSPLHVCTTTPQCPSSIHTYIHTYVRTRFVGLVSDVRLKKPCSRSCDFPVPVLFPDRRADISYWTAITRRSACVELNGYSASAV